MKVDIGSVGMTPSETQFLVDNLTENDIMLEYGSGYSTLYLPQFVETFVSIEHDKNWANKIRSELKDTFDNVEYYHVPIHEQRFDDELDSAAPLILQGARNKKPETVRIVDDIWYWNTRGQFDWHCAIEYIKKPLTLDHRYDVVFVDGRARAFCAYLGLQLLVDDGLLFIHDYTNRWYYHGIENYCTRLHSVGTLTVFKKDD